MKDDTKKKVIVAAINTATLIVCFTVGGLIGALGNRIKDRIL